jgi:hypothetical protein
MITTALSVLGALPWRLIALAAIAASLAIGGCQFGEQRVQAKWDAEKSATTLQAARTEVAQTEATTQVVTKYVDRIQVVRERGNDIVKEVPIYVPNPSDPAACALPGGFRVFHDAAAQGELPDPAKRVDAAAVTAQDVAATVADNYATCNANTEQLKALQEWARAQQEVTR